MEPTLYFLDIGTESDIGPDTKGNGPGTILIAHPGSDPKPLITNQPFPDGIDISPTQSRIFWTNMGIPSANDGTVRSATLDGTDVRTIIPAGAVHTPKQICIDQTASKLYFCDREGLRVHRCDLDGGAHEVIYTAGDWRDPTSMKDQTRHCVGIAVDATTGYFYWSQKGPSKGGVGRIFRARIAMPPGSRPDDRPDVELLFENLPEPIDLEIDHDTQVLYWSDRGNYPTGNTLNRAYVGTRQEAALRGENDRVVVSAWPKYDVITKHFHEAIGVKLDKTSKCIWITDIGGAVYRVDLNGGNKTRVYDTEKAFTGIAVYYKDG